MLSGESCIYRLSGVRHGRPESNARIGAEILKVSIRRQSQVDLMRGYCAGDLASAGASEGVGRVERRALLGIDKQRSETDVEVTYRFAAVEGDKEGWGRPWRLIKDLICGPLAQSMSLGFYQVTFTQDFPRSLLPV
jgi:hypothetical protein